MLSSTSEALDTAVGTPDARVAAPNPECETTEAGITSDGPEYSSKRHSGSVYNAKMVETKQLTGFRAGEKEQKAVNKRQKFYEQMINWHNEARAAGKIRYDQRRAQAIETGRLECLQLCAKLHTLPRELRDLVYGEIIGPYNRESVKRVSKETSRAIVGPGLKLINHELYRAEPTDSTGLGWWLDTYTEDIFSKGLEPGLLVQRIHAHVYGPPIELDRSLDPQVLNLILFDNLKSTLSQVQTQNVKLYIRVRSYFTIKALRLALERLGPVVYQLRKEGFGRIKVQRTTGISDYTFLFDGQETLFKDRLDEWELTANPKM